MLSLAVGVSIGTFSFRSASLAGLVVRGSVAGETVEEAGADCDDVSDIVPWADKNQLNR